MSSDELGVTVEFSMLPELVLEFQIPMLLGAKFPVSKSVILKLEDKVDGPSRGRSVPFSGFSVGPIACPLVGVTAIVGLLGECLEPVLVPNMACLVALKELVGWAPRRCFLGGISDVVVELDSVAVSIDPVMKLEDRSVRAEVMSVPLLHD